MRMQMNGSPDSRPRVSPARQEPMLADLADPACLRPAQHALEGCLPADLPPPERPTRTPPSQWRRWLIRLRCSWVSQLSADADCWAPSAGRRSQPEPSAAAVPCSPPTPLLAKPHCSLAHMQVMPFQVHVLARIVALKFVRCIVSAATNLMSSAQPLCATGLSQTLSNSGRSSCIRTYEWQHRSMEWPDSLCSQAGVQCRDKPADRLAEGCEIQGHPERDAAVQMEIHPVTSSILPMSHQRLCTAVRTRSLH